MKLPPPLPPRTSATVGAIPPPSYAVMVGTNPPPSYAVMVGTSPPPLPSRPSVEDTRPVQPPPLPSRPSVEASPVEDTTCSFDGCCDNGCAGAYFKIMSKNSLSYPLWHGILVGFFFMFNLIDGGLFFAIGTDSEEYKIADSIDQLVGCRWKSLGTGTSAALSVVAIFVSMIPAIVSFFLVKNSPEDCRSAFKVKRFEAFHERVSVANINEVRRISFLVKTSYIYTGIPLILLSMCLNCALASTITFCAMWVFICLLGFHSEGLSVELPTNGSRLNDVLSPPGGYRCYTGLFLASVGLGIDDSDSLMVIPIFIIFFTSLMALDFHLPLFARPTTGELVGNIVDALETLETSDV